MEKQVEETVRNCIGRQLIRVIISNPREKSEGNIFKVKIRPFLLNGEIRYQATEYIGSQVIHKNFTDSEAVEYILRMVEYSFKQCEIVGKEVTAGILVSKKGKITVNVRKNKLRQIDMQQGESMLQHNRTRNYILKEGIPVPFLMDLGVMNRQGDIVKSRYDKFRQINRFLEFIRDVEDELPKNREIRIIDFGCGKSYLTFAVYYYLHELKGLDVSITGLDLKKDVIEKCNRLSDSYGYDKLIFKPGDIAEYTGQDSVDMVITLHACDTATDYALYKAVTWNSKVILSVPCCQHELNKQIHNKTMQPVLNYGILKERMSALMTDAIRAEVLKIKGYRTDILEFIDMEHTPKNLLIRAVMSNETGDIQSLKQMAADYGVTPSIMKLFQI
ncbi:MAG: SAM-dependent methyltransferase [Lachnospiraceae bacterium]|nr:SAM-dependent methyltransferase [Lachnospiraceae bacterium]